MAKKQTYGSITGETPIGRRFEFSDETDEWGVTFGGIDPDGNAFLFFDNGDEYPGPCTVDEWNTDFADDAEGFKDGQYDALPAELKPKPAPKAAKPTARPPAKPKAAKPGGAATPPAEPTPPAGDANAPEPTPPAPEPEKSPENGVVPLSVEQTRAIIAARSTIAHCDSIVGKLGAIRSERKDDFDDADTEWKDAKAAADSARSQFVETWDEVVSGKSGYGTLFDTPSPDDAAENDEDNTATDVPAELADVSLTLVGTAKGVQAISAGRLAKLAEAGIETIGEAKAKEVAEGLATVPGLGGKAAPKVIASIDGYIAAKSTA